MVSFGRKVEFDERSRDYPIRALLGERRRVPQPMVWPCHSVLDQGSEGACVGFSWAHELIAEPEVVPDVTSDYAFMLYHEAQRLDEWEGEDYEGTSVLAGAKAVTAAQWIQEYRWAFGLTDVLETLSYFGPLILGINWYEGMLNPDSNSYIHPTGNIVGGHAILARGVNPDGRSVLLHNSWGESWGNFGTCLINWDDLDRLLHEYGEACVPVLRTHIEDEPVEPIGPEPIEPQQGCLSDIFESSKRFLRDVFK